MVRGFTDMDADAAGQVAIPLLGGGDTLNFERGRKVYELTNHLGNVLVTISDKKRQHDGGSGVVDYYTADVLSAQDYYSFGMVMPGRSYTYGSGYRYGFNGKENDNEIKGEGNQQDYGMRIYDPRLGRFHSVDPLTKKYPELTPYQFASNRPIDGIDLDGAERMGYIKKFEYNGSISDNPVENVPNAIGNGIINILNLVPDLWNSGVSNVESAKKGTWAKDLKSDIDNKFNGVSDYLHNSVEYSLNTPIKQQLADVGHTLDNPQTLEAATSLYVSWKIPSFGEATSFLKKPTPKPWPIHSIYADGMVVFEGSQPGKIKGINMGSESEFSHSVMKWDQVNKRVYKAREFNAGNQPIKDIDFTNPTFPNGTPRPGHWVPEQHPWVKNPSGGTPIRGEGEEFKLTSNYNFYNGHL